MRGSERTKYALWEILSNTQKHMILMYFYRVETEPMEELENYVEVHRFRQYGIKREDLPLAVTAIKGEALKRKAHEAIGKTL